MEIVNISRNGQGFALARFYFSEDSLEETPPSAVVVTKEKVSAVCPNKHSPP